MAHRADAVDGSHAIQLGTAGISVDAHTVECLCTRAVAIIGSRREFPLMGPDGTLCTTVGFALSTVDHVDLIHLAIAIPVVVGIVNIIIGQLQGLNDHLGRIHVIALRVVLSVVGVGLRHGVGAHNVEVQFEDTFALGIEIVVHGPLERAMVEILLVGDALVEVSVILFLELGCAKVHQYDEASLFAHVTANLTNLLAAKTFGTACVRLLTACFSTQFQLLQVGAFEHVVNRTLHVGAAIAGQPVVDVLVASELCCHGSAVGQCQESLLTRLGRYGTHAQGYEHHDKTNKNLLHFLMGCCWLLRWVHFEIYFRPFFTTMPR